MLRSIFRGGQNDDARTSWPHVLVAITAGYGVCFQLGKVPAALPLIGEDFALTLWQSGAIISSLSVLTAILGIFVGLWANRHRAERTALLALTIAVVAGLAGAMSEGFIALLATRIVEGLGYIIAMATLPAIVSAYTAPADRAVALAGWGSSVPGGMAVLMLASPVLIDSGGLGWRGLWVVTALAIACIACVMCVVFRKGSAGASKQSRQVVTPQSMRGDLRDAVQWQTITLVVLFALYSVQFLGVVSFLPTMLVKQSGLSLATAGFFSGIVAVGNAAGSILAGPLIKSGVPRRTVIIAGYLIMAGAAALVLTQVLPLGGRLAAAVVFAIAGALIPGTIWTFVPELAQRPSQAPIFAGMFIQGSGIGQIVGPVLLGGLVDTFGRWEYALILTGTASFIGIVLTVLFPPHITRVGVSAGSAVVRPRT